MSTSNGCALSNYIRSTSSTIHQECPSAPRLGRSWRTYLPIRKRRIFFNTFSGTDTITASNRSTYVAKGQGKRAPSSVQVTHTTTAFARPHLTNESVTTAHHTTLREEQRRAHGPRLNSKHDCHDARQFCTTTQLCTDCEVGWGQGGTVPMSDPSSCQDDATAIKESFATGRPHHTGP